MLSRSRRNRPPVVGVVVPVADRMSALLWYELIGVPERVGDAHLSLERDDAGHVAAQRRAGDVDQQLGPRLEVGDAADLLPRVADAVDLRLVGLMHAATSPPASSGSMPSRNAHVPIERRAIVGAEPAAALELRVVVVDRVDQLAVGILHRHVRIA